MWAKIELYQELVHKYRLTEICMLNISSLCERMYPVAFRDVKSTLRLSCSEGILQADSLEQVITAGERADLAL